MELFHPTAAHGAFPPELYNMKKADVMKVFPQMSLLNDFLDTLVIREAGGEKDNASNGVTVGEGKATKMIEEFDYAPAIKEASELWERLRKDSSRQNAAYMFMYRAVARQVAAFYLHIDQYRNFHSKYDNSKNFLDQDFGLAKDRVPEALETLVLDTEKATRGYAPEDDTVQLLKDNKLSFVLAYPDYAAAFTRPGTEPTDCHKLDPISYMLGGESERYFKLLHLAVESKLGPLVESAQAIIDGMSSEKRAEIIERAADAATAAASVIIKMPELSDPAMYLHLRWFIQGPYNSPSYPNGLNVKGVTIRPGGETGSQSSFGIMSDLISGARFHFQEDSLSKMEEIHRVTREQATIDFLDRLRAAAKNATCCNAEKRARARLLQATNFYLLGHSGAYTIHVLAQQKSTVQVSKTDEPAAKKRKEDVATGGSAGGFLIKKVIERQDYLDKLISELEGTDAPFQNKESNELFKKQLDLVKAHTEGHNRENGLDLSILKKLVGFSEENAVSITPPKAA
jgi:hypothetical protein